MANHHFREFPDLIEFYTTIGTSTILKEEYTTIEKHTILKDIKNFITIPNQILQVFHTTIGQYPTQNDFLAITPKDISYWEFYLKYHNN